MYCASTINTLVTNTLAAGAARVASVLAICVRPTTTTPIMMEIRRNARCRERARTTNERGGRGRETVSKMEEAALTADSLDSVDYSCAIIHFVLFSKPL